MHDFLRKIPVAVDFETGEVMPDAPSASSLPVLRCGENTVVCLSFYRRDEDGECVAAPLPQGCTIWAHGSCRGVDQLLFLAGSSRINGEGDWLNAGTANSAAGTLSLRLDTATAAFRQAEKRAAELMLEREQHGASAVLSLKPQIEVFATDERGETRVLAQIPFEFRYCALALPQGEALPEVIRPAELVITDPAVSMMVCDPEFGNCCYLDATMPQLQFFTRLWRLRRIKLLLASADAACTGDIVVVPEFDGTSLEPVVCPVGAEPAWVTLPVVGSGSLRLRRAFDDARDTLRDEEPVTAVVLNCSLVIGAVD